MITEVNRSQRTQYLNPSPLVKLKIGELKVEHSEREYYLNRLCKLAERMGRIKAVVFRIQGENSLNNRQVDTIEHHCKCALELIDGAYKTEGTEND